jgi:hypothetical protein
VEPYLIEEDENKIVPGQLRLTKLVQPINMSNQTRISKNKLILTGTASTILLIQFSNANIYD